MNKDRWNELNSGVCWSIMFALASLVMSIVALVNKCPRCGDNLGFDYLGIIIAILALMVTFLVGWQIFSLINIKGIEDRVKEANNQVNKNFGELCSEMSCCFAGDKTMIHAVISFTIHALIYYSSIGDFEQCEREIESLCDVDKTQVSLPKLNSMFHRMTGEIKHPEKIKNFHKLTEFINSSF